MKKYYYLAEQTGYKGIYTEKQLLKLPIGTANAAYLGNFKSKTQCIKQWKKYFEKNPETITIAAPAGINGEFGKNTGNKKIWTATINKQDIMEM